MPIQIELLYSHDAAVADDDDSDDDDDVNDL